MLLSQAQVSQIRNDIGDTSSNPAFSDYEIEQLGTLEDTYNKTVLRAVDQLISSSAKFYEYTANESTDKKNQIFANLLEVRKIWKARVDAEAQAEVVATASTTPSTIRFRIGANRRTKDVPSA